LRGSVESGGHDRVLRIKGGHAAANCFVAGRGFVDIGSGANHRPYTYRIYWLNRRAGDRGGANFATGSAVRGSGEETSQAGADLAVSPLINREWMHEAYRLARKGGSPSVDGMWRRIIKRT
jgi:hypothetical protein